MIGQASIERPLGARTDSNVRAPNGLGLCMIVKNEARLIERCLMSVRPVISHWTIVDTGSTDGTQSLIRKTRILRDLPGKLHERPWKDFSTNRNESIELATGKTSHVLVIDADDVLELANEFELPKLTEDSYTMNLVYGDKSPVRTHIFRPELFKYEGVLHEHLSPLPPNCPAHGMRIRIMGGGGRSKNPNKFVDDAHTLMKALETDPNNSRYVFYLGQSWLFAFKTSGNKTHLASALEAYEKRIAMGGGAQEEISISISGAAGARKILASPVAHGDGQ
jgi:glycosyltransferase involved in cell wall biosynthesis